MEKQEFFHRRVVVREGLLRVYQQNSERGLTEMDVYVPLPEYYKARDSMTRQLPPPRPLSTPTLLLYRNGVMITMHHVGYFKDLFYGFSIQAGDQMIALATSTPEGRWDWKRTLLAHGAKIREDIVKGVSWR
jgi:hypothetical protein